MRDLIQSYSTVIVKGFITALLMCLSFFTGRWINDVDGAVDLVYKHETQLAVLTEIQKQSAENSHAIVEELREVRRDIKGFKK